MRIYIFRYKSNYIKRDCQKNQRKYWVFTFFGNLNEMSSALSKRAISSKIADFIEKIDPKSTRFHQPKAYD